MNNSCMPSAGRFRRLVFPLALAVVGGFQPMAAWADAADALRVFVKEVKAGQSSFTQTVYAPNGTKPKVSSGRFEFQRPNRFRFSYVKPYVQLIVGDGVKVWFHDPDLNQVTVRRLAEALGSTPAALLASGASLDDDFELKALPDQGGLQWVQATPRQQGGTVLWLKVGFRPGARVPATFEMGDSFGQRSVLSLPDLREESSLPAATFRFTPPAGADISEQ